MPDVGRLEEYVQLHRETGFALQSRHLGESLGWYVADGGPLNQVVSLWPYHDHEDRGARRARLQADEAWRGYLRQVTPLFDAMENRFLTPVSLAR